MAFYQYQPLDSSKDEVRLLTLIHGNGDEALEAYITHVSLPPLPAVEDHRMSLLELRKTLPYNWFARETLDGRYIFEQDITGKTRWKHPDRSIRSRHYIGYPPDPREKYEPKFEALSYVWGSTIRDRPIAIRTQNESSESAPSYLFMTENLELALRSLRYPRDDRVLWIDSLCINQDDVEERNHEVQRMRQIYSSSHRNVLWLGPGTESTGYAIDTLSESDRLEFTVDNQCLVVPQTSESYREWWKSPLTSDDHNSHALLDFFQHKWFDRLWIVQEALLSPRKSVVQCGQDMMPWTLLRRAIRALMLKRIVHPILESILARCRDSLCWSQSTPLDLIARSSQRECTDPRDRIYALLGLVPRDFASLIEVNYSASLEEVLLHAFKTLNSYTNRIDAIQYGRIDNQLRNMPTWLATWNNPPGLSTIVPNNWDASGNAAGHIGFLDSRTLQVQGVIVEKVVQRSEAMTSRQFNASPTFIESYGLMKNHLLTNSAWVMDGFVSTWTMYHNVETHPRSSYPPHEYWLGVFDKLFKAGANSNVARELQSELHKALGRQLPNFTFFTTTGGRFGITTYGVHVRPGKYIALSDGIDPIDTF
jgi:hypothetical protein